VANFPPEWVANFSPESAANFDRNRWPTCPGIRIFHHTGSFAPFDPGLCFLLSYRPNPQFSSERLSGATPCFPQARPIFFSNIIPTRRWFASPIRLAAGGLKKSLPKLAMIVKPAKSLRHPISVLRILAVQLHRICSNSNPIV
jgi:hypothetical protein